METIVLSIDGKTVTASSGMNILEAADRNGIHIPRLCHHPDLKPAGACRLCLVEDEKTGRLMAACVTPASMNQKILTRTHRILNHRRNIVRLMIAEHPESCVVCNKGNRCALRKVAATLGVGDTNLYPMPITRPFEQANPFITRDLSKCILCGKCIRADHELVAVGAIDYTHRGFVSRPATLHYTGLEESACTFCGTCVSICPTGALGIRHASFVGTPERESDTTCGFCPVGCRLSLGVSGNNVVNVNPSPDHGSVNGATLCVRGHFAHDYLNTGTRLLSPSIRKPGEDETPRLVPVSWDAAIAAVAEGLLRIKANNGPQSIAFLGSSKCTNEENYLFQKIARVLVQTNNIDNGGYISGQMLLAEFDEKTRGRWRRNPLSSIESADTIMLMGADLTHCTPVVGYHVKRAARNGTSLIVVDPRKTEIAAFSSVWLRLKPGSDLELLNGLAALLVETNGYHSAFIDNHTEGFSIFRYGLSSLKLGDMCRATGIDKGALENVAAILKGKKISFILGNGFLQQRHPRQTLGALTNLLLLTGSLGTDGSGIYMVGGENNHMGALDMGAVPGFLPGRQRLDAQKNRKRWEKAWGVSLSPDMGLNMVRMVEAMEQGHIKAMYIMGENPLRALPESTRVKQALENLDFLVVQDILDGETAQMADVVLSGAAFCEKAGSFTNIEGRIQAFSPVISPPGHAKQDWEILDLIWAKLGDKESYGSPQRIQQEIRRVIPMYSEVSENGNGWLLPDNHTDFSRSEGGPIPFSPVASSEKLSASEAFPLTAIFGALRYHAGSGTRTTTSSRIRKMAAQGIVEVSPEDAKFYGLTESDPVTVRSAVGVLKRRVRLSGKIQQGQVYVPVSEDGTGALGLIGLQELYTGWNTCPVNLEKGSSNETAEN